MTLREKLEVPSTQIRVGLVFLILASLAKWILRPDVGLSNPWTDGLTGFLYGVAIGLMLLGIWRNSGRGRARDVPGRGR